MCQYSYITPAFLGSPWWGEINLEMSGCGGNEPKMCEMGWKWVKLGENTKSPMWKKHQDLLSNNNDAKSITIWVSGKATCPNSRAARALHLRPP